MTPERFADLYRSERGELARSISRIAGPDQAEDLVHDAFLAYLATDPGANRPGAWLSRVARNRALNHVRRPRTIQLPPDTCADVGDTPGLGAEREATRAIVAATLEGLGERSRTALQLRFFEGRSYAEIATALGVRVGQAHVVVHRATRRFGRELVRRIAEAHGAQECAEAVSSLVGITPGDAADSHGPSSCARCRSIWDELAALRSLPALAPALGLRRFLASAWRRALHFAEPARHVAEGLAAATVAVASVAGTAAAPGTVPLLRPAPFEAPAQLVQRAQTTAVAPTQITRQDAKAAARERPVTATSSKAGPGVLQVTKGDSHTQVDATEDGSGGGVVVCEPLEPCPPP